MIIPQFRGTFRRDPSTLWLVEKVDDWLIGFHNVLPIITAELGFETDHGTEGCPSSQLWWNPSVPVTDGGDDFEVHLVHHARNADVACPIGVGPVPE